MKQKLSIVVDVLANKGSALFTTLQSWEDKDPVHTDVFSFEKAYV